MLMFVAVQLLAQLEMQNNQIEIMEKPDVCDGRASAHLFVVLL
jgi:hypothetical protein